MLERGDFKTFHEPFIYLYYIHDAKKELIHFDVDPTHPTSYDDIKSMLLEAARHSPVFVKDMCYYVSDYILEDVDFLKRIRSTFLIRDPRRAIISYYKIDGNVSLEEIGLEAQYRQYERIKEITGEQPVVIDAQDIIDDTETTIRAYCSALGLNFIPDSLYCG